MKNSFFLILCCFSYPTIALAAKYESPMHAFVVGALSWILFLAFVYLIKWIIKQSKSKKSNDINEITTKHENSISNKETDSDERVGTEYEDNSHEIENKNSNEKVSVTQKSEILAFFQGKNNVNHIVIKGIDVWISDIRSFDEEILRKGATKFNTFENERKHIMFLFNDNDEEVGRYYIGKKLQGKAPEQIENLIDNIEFFETWNSNKKEWVPCVGLRMGLPTSISEKAISLKNRIKR